MNKKLKSLSLNFLFIDIRISFISMAVFISLPKIETPFHHYDEKGFNLSKAYWISIQVLA